MENRLILKEFEHHLPGPFLLRFGEQFLVSKADFRSVLNPMNLRLKLTGDKKIKESKLIRVLQETGLFSDKNYIQGDYFVFRNTHKSEAEKEAERIMERIENNAISDAKFIADFNKHRTKLSKYLDDENIQLDKVYHYIIEDEINHIVDLMATFCAHRIYMRPSQVSDETLGKCWDIFTYYNDKFRSLPPPAPLPTGDPYVSPFAEKSKQTFISKLFSHFIK